ncbi:hypothetical protein BKA69DRAFT_1062211 [Paraphysoderma sedebokerense]|nr:hypothetical protein BKA69DRAFT_1062211 [Paraphysoderma sedebokerense]
MDITTSEPPSHPDAMSSSIATTSPAANAASVAANRSCSACSLPLTGQFVRALGGTYHLNCFTCLDCNQVVAAKFFPYENPSDGKQYPLCERDYFKRLDLICAKCNGALRGSYINALNRKYHVDHFTCSVCPTVFGPSESYYEHDGDVFCHYHYSTVHATKCGGCNVAILKQFVEINRNGVEEQWHPECYMIHKSWNIRLAAPEFSQHSQLNQDSASRQLSADTLKKEQKDMEEKVTRIWTVLSAFEESAAACISDMLLNVSNGMYVDGVNEAANFIYHVEKLFAGIDVVETQLAKFGDKTGLVHTKEPRMLAKKVVGFFSLLTHTHDSPNKRLGITQELLSLVTSLAHLLKILIRIALSGALKLERIHKYTLAIHDFLNTLMEVSESERDFAKATNRTPTSTPPNVASHRTAIVVDTDVKSDLCFNCRNTIEEACIRLPSSSQRWHLNCFVCAKTGKSLKHEYKESAWDSKAQEVLSKEFKGERDGLVYGFEYVTQLQQYTFLLRVALKRYYSLLRAKGEPDIMESSSVAGSTEKLDKDKIASNSAETSAEDISNVTKLMADHGLDSFVKNQNDLISKQRTLVEPVIASSVHNLIESIHGGPGVTSSSLSLGHKEDDPSSHDTAKGQHYKTSETDLTRSSSIRRSSPSPSKPIPISSTSPSSTPHATSGGMVRPIPSPNATSQSAVSRALNHDDSSSELSPSTTKRPVITAADIKLPLSSSPNDPYPPQSSNSITLAPSSVKQSPKRNTITVKTKTYLSELTALEYFMVKHMVVVQLENLLKDFYTIEELIDAIGSTKKNSGFWSRFLNSLKPKTKTNTKVEGTFGVPLEILVERYGVNSSLGSGPGRIRIPKFVDVAINVMKSCDLYTEGIFRINGNIKKLKILADELDTDPNNVQLQQVGVIQIAALLKKFLREMPEPLLTFKLHKLFIDSQRIDTDETTRKKILHLACCLMPKPNRDLLEVLCIFLRQVSTFALPDDETKGSKMDLYNLATVIAPNILYSKAKEPSREDSMLAVQVIYSILLLQDDFWTVPEDLAPFLNDQSLANELNPDLDTKEAIQKAQELVKLKRSNSSRDVMVTQSHGLRDKARTAVVENQV